MTYSILHISDLHRSADDPISNDELISALVGDKERYTSEHPNVIAPNAIVVSGDLIQGVPLGAKDFAKSLEDQYKTADQFLIELTDRFVEGDRSRVVIVPGNHDIDWNTALEAMRPVPSDEEPQNLAAALFKEDSKFRWNWKEKKLYRIVDDEKYASRLDAFWNFFGRFYAGVHGLLRVAPKSPANLYNLMGGRVAVAAFNSCEGNDCFAFHGLVRREVIARTHLDLNGLAQNCELKIAVWHHSLDGAPYRSDYMDSDIVRGMIGRGFRIGLYGHHHKAQAVAQEIYLPDRVRMAVVSAGSLCAGRSELPTGVHRQYNLIELADDLRSARVHVRSMAIANLFARAYLWDFGGSSYATIDWDPPRNEVGLTKDVFVEQERRFIEVAEAAYNAGELQRAISLLEKTERRGGTYQRQLLLAVAHAAENWPLILAETNPPTTIDELSRRVNAFCQIDAFDKARNVLNEFSEVLGLPESVKAELVKRVAAIEAIKQ